jgi:small subunit ribosomal protein S1
VQKTTNFGAIVEIAERVEGLLHLSDITSDRRLNHPKEVLKTGQSVPVKVLEIDRANRRLKLGMKQLEPTEMDKYVATVAVGDTVNGRVLKASVDKIDVELDEGVRGVCRLAAAEAPTASEEPSAAPDADVSSLGARLQAAWKGGAPGGGGQAANDFQTGEVRTFKVTHVDAESGVIELALA